MDWFGTLLCLCVGATQAPLILGHFARSALLSARMNTSTATFLISAPEYHHCPEPTLPEFAFAGRSNVGKSSLLNFLVGKRDLAKVSATPGHTKHLNFFEIERRWRLVDLPGYGYARTERGERGRFSRAVAEYLANRPTLECTFELIDASLEPQEYDLEFLQWMIENEVPFVIVFTKTDRVSTAKLAELEQTYREILGQWCEQLPEFYSCSSVARTGRNGLLKLIESVVRERAAQPPPKSKPKRNTPW